MLIHLDIDEYVSLIKGEYRLIPCDQCDLGTIYINGDIGEQISQTEYRKLEDQDFEWLDTEMCDKCYGVGKIARFD